MKVKNRVKKHEEFTKIINNAHVEKNAYFIGYILKNEFGYTRIGISVSKRLGIAVTRNRIKRQIRSMIGENLSLDASVDIILVVRVSYDRENYQKMAEELKIIIAKLKRSINE
ncbi:MAG: ribonuclease P protein component [Methanomicrobia archaeon]|jgi:ribonuclease P protein component|nr:ribonuclease P protein component [Methanomicrobia archaeon]